MNVLMISNDKRILNESSAVARRMVEYYGDFVDRLDIFVLGTEGDYIRLSDTTTAYPVLSNKVLALISTPMAPHEDVDVVTAQDPFLAGLVGYRISKKLNARLDLQLHGDILSKYFRNESMLNWLRFRTARFLLPHADSVRVVSPRIKESLKGIVPLENVVVLPIFVSVNDYGHGEDRSDVYENRHPLLVTISRLSKEKNIPLALRAVKLLSISYPEMLLVIVGDGPERNHLEGLVRRYGIEENVRFEGWQENTKQYYEAADVYLLTSDHEGYCRTLVEAALVGVSIVSTDVGIASSIEGAHVVSVGDEQLFFEVLQSIFKSPSRPTALPSWIPLNKEEYLKRYERLWE